MNSNIDALVHWYETLNPASLERIGEFYTENAYFRDPFNEVNGQSAIRKIMQDMFEKLENPRFVVEERIVEGSSGFMVWRFAFSVRRRPMEIQGSTHVRFAADGRVDFHRDYWDAAGELYAKLPVVGWLVRRLGSLFSS